METSRKTRPGVLIWTPAPVLKSRTSCLMEGSWEEEDDFFSQMDENGIIGLSEVLEEVKLEEMDKNNHKPPEPAAPDESEASQLVEETKPEELSSSLRELWDQTQSSEQDQQALLTCWFKASMDNETLRQKNNKQTARNCPEEEKGGEEDEMESDRRKKHELISTSAGLGAAAGLTGSVNLLDVGPADNSGHPCPGSQPASPIKASFLPHLFHLTPEELAAAPGIEVETFPDFSESLSESCCSNTSIRSSPCCPELNLRASPLAAASFSEQFISNHYNLFSPNPTEASEKPHPSPIKTKTLSPETLRTFSLSRVKTNSSESKQQQTSHNRNSKIPRRVSDDAAAMDEFRSRSHQTPDFSKVEPRVNFPKSGYTPPRSKQSPTGASLSHGPPLVFKSAADIMEDVLFNNSDGYSTSSDSDRTPTSAAKFIVPPEFRCRQQATTLFQQLQEEYSKLLIKYAEAENTIDRLRLEAKVNLNSDPPKAGLSVNSALNHNASKFLKLDFSQSQRAEISSAHLCSGTHSTLRENSVSHPSNPQSGQKLANYLFSQTEKFLQQLQDSDDLFRSENLTAFQKIEVLSRLSEGLDSLECSYLLAQDEHKHLQQRGVETCCFDPERELEGLIFQCGLHIEELKEQAEQQQICVPSSSLPHSSSEEDKTLTQSQSPPSPVSDAAELETSSASKRSDEEEDDEETLRALYQRPQICKHTGVQPESTKPVNHIQILKENPKLPKHSPSPDLRTSIESGNQEEKHNGQRTGNGEVLKILPQRKVESDQDSPVHTRRQRCSRASLASNTESSVTSAPPARSRRRLAMRRTPSSSQSSLPDTTSQRRGSKAQTGSRRVLSQDGIISPETDSGFVGSESSHLTPAAAPSLLQQRATESVSVPQDGNSRNSQPASPPSSPSLSHTAQESTVGSQLDPNQPRRTRQGQRRPMFSCPPQRYDSQRRHNGSVSRTSEVWVETPTPTGSEVEQSDRYSRSVNSPLISHTDSPQAAYCLHGDSQRALSSRQGVNHNEAVVPLQAEVARLKEKLENCLRSSVAASPSAQRSYVHHINSTPFIRSEGVWSEERLGRRETREGGEVDHTSALRQTERARSAAQKQKPQQDFSLRSVLEPSTTQFQVSRCTQTSAAPHSGSLVHNRKTQTWQQSVSDTEEKADSRDQGRLCPQCLINVRGHEPLGGDRSPSSLSHCSRCGGLKPHKYTKTDHLKQNPPTHQNFQPAESPARDANRRYAASPSVLQFMPVFPPQLLLCSAALHTSPDKITAASSGTRRPEERKKETTRRSLSVDRSLDSSLNRAITAARHMKHTSRHMAQSLASGLQHHEQHLLAERVRTVN